MWRRIIVSCQPVAQRFRCAHSYFVFAILGRQFTTATRPLERSYTAPTTRSFFSSTALLRILPLGQGLAFVLEIVSLGNTLDIPLISLHQAIKCGIGRKDIFRFQWSFWGRRKARTGS